MDMKDNSNLIISILLNLLAVLLKSTLFLFYKVVIAEEINNDLNMENLMLYKDKKELAENVIGSSGESWITELGNDELMSLLRLG